ncbi:MAG: hypothetical protein JNG84_02625, partial [Archangium sp.]|nr:hypothetical protein [Archangium sp.]
MADEKKDDVNPITPGWEKQLYTPERMKQWFDGDISFQELNKISGPEMLQMAIFGFQQYEQGKYTEAQTLFEALTDLDDKEPYYLIALGAVYLAQDEL